MSRAIRMRRRGSTVIEGDELRWLRPVPGDVAQFRQFSHTGVDIAAPVGSIIVAADGGIVNKVGWQGVGGQGVCVSHGGGLETCYFHTAGALVSLGQRVVRGQPVAIVGMTGRDDRSAPPLGSQALRPAHRPAFALALRHALDRDAAFAQRDLLNAAPTTAPVHRWRSRPTPPPERARSPVDRGRRA